MPYLRANRGSHWRRLASIPARGCSPGHSRSRQLGLRFDGSGTSSRRCVVAGLITREPFRRGWFLETPTGNCRLTLEFSKKLSETALTWGRLVAPYAERVASLLWSRRPKSSNDIASHTRLTQRHKREAKGAAPLPRIERAPRPERLCRDCGKTIRDGHALCSVCNRGCDRPARHRRSKRPLRCAHPG